VEVERLHSGALSRLEEQEEMHRSFIKKSDDFTALLEQDRERLVERMARTMEKISCFNCVRSNYLVNSH